MYRAQAKKISSEPMDLYECLEIKRRFLRLFVDTTVSLKLALKEEEPDIVDSMIEMREACIRKINEIDKHLRLYSQQFPDYYAQLSQDGKARISQIARAIEEILDQMNELNKECIASAVQRLKMIQDEMSRTVRNRHEIHGRYDKAQTSRFVDLTF